VTSPIATWCPTTTGCERRIEASSPLDGRLFAHDEGGLMDLSVVIPAYRCAATLPELFERLIRVLDRMSLEYEIICVDDGSQDDTWQTLERLWAKHPGRVVAVRLVRNYEQHNALMCGFHHARGNLVATLDADLQHSPEELPKLLAAIRQHDSDLVYGSYARMRQSFVRRVGSMGVMAFYRHALRTDVAPTSFRVVRRELIESILTYDKPFTVVDGLLAWNTNRVSQVVIDHQPRAHGRSAYGISKLFLLAFNVFTNFSLLPLRVISTVGLLLAVLGACVAIFSIAGQGSLNGAMFATTLLVGIMLVLGGLQLLAIGLVGEYLGRTHMNVSRMPQYVER